ncbi:MAG: GAF domain-containing protein, partial [Chloroflexi bacterium]|nr:GAF domain-containing protein [Chloroflexota bacterium]
MSNTRVARSWGIVHAWVSSLGFRVTALVLLALMPVLGLVIYTAVEHRRDAALQAKQDALRLAQEVESRQQRSFADARQLLTVVSRDPAVQSGDPADCSKYLADLLKLYPQYTSLTVVNADGDLWCNALPQANPINVRERPTFQRVMATREFVIGDYRVGATTGRAILGYGYPVLDDAGKLIGATFAGLDLTGLNPQSILTNFPPGTAFTILDRNATVLVSYPDSQEWLGKSVADEPIVRAALGNRGLSTYDGPRLTGDPGLAAIGPIISGPDGGDLFVVVSIPHDVAFAAANAGLRRNLIGLGVVLGVSIIAALVLGELFVIRRTRAIAGAARRLASGDLTARTGLKPESGELGDVARSFDQMAGILQEREAERNRAEEERTRLLRERAAREAAEKAQKRADFLAHVGGVLVSTLDYETALENVARLAVPEIADWCAVVLVEADGQAVVKSIAHTDPERVDLVREMMRRYPPLKDPEVGTLKVIRTGKPEIYPEVTDAMLARAARDAEHLEMLRKLGFRSGMVVPIGAHGETFGALSLISGPSGRQFTQDDLALAEDVARRCGLAIYSSRLYSAEQGARARAEAASRRRMAQFAVSRVLLEARPLHETAPRILEAIGEHLQWDTGVLWLEQRPGTGFHVVAAWHHQAGPELPVSSAVSPVHVEGARLPEVALKRGQPLWLPDIGQSDGPDGGPQAGDGFRSAIYVPVRSERGVIGVIAMYGRQPKPEEREATESLATLGNQIGQFIERQRAADLIRELSTPVLPIGDRLLLVPLVGQLYPQRAVQLMDHMLAAIRAN